MKKILLCLGILFTVSFFTSVETVHAAAGASEFVYSVKETSTPVLEVTEVDTGKYVEKTIFDSKNIPQTGIKLSQHSMFNLFLSSCFLLALLLLIYKRADKREDCSVGGY